MKNYALWRGLKYLTLCGQVGTAIFTFVIAVHTFSLLCLRRKWPDWACYMTLITSCTIIALDLCIGNFVVANVDKRGPYYGITSYWCWITPAYSTEQYTSEYLFIFASAGFSLILYLLVFFRLRGNITISAGYKVDFHRRPKVRMGRTEAGTYIATDDRHVESHLTTVAKQMLWHPIAYIVIILPFATARFSTFSGISVPSAVPIFTSALFVLTGFVNTVLFCTTRSVLPGNWRQRFGIEILLATRGDPGLSTWRNSTRRRPESGARMGTLGRTSIILNIGVEKESETKQSEGDAGPASIKLRTPTSLTCPIQAYDGKQQADNHSLHFPHTSFLPPLDELVLEHEVSACGHRGPERL